MSDEWEPLTPARVAEHLAGFDGPWWIGGGVALDLFRGQPPAPHRRTQVVVFADHWPALGAVLEGWEVRTENGAVRARPDPAGPWVVEFVLAERSGADWVHPGHPDVTTPITDLGLATDDGIPYLRPEIVLLSLAGEGDDGHDAELDTSLPALGVGPRCWLAGALDLAHPGHPWITRVL